MEYFFNPQFWTHISLALVPVIYSYFIHLSFICHINSLLISSLSNLVIYYAKVCTSIEVIIRKKRFDVL